MADDKALVEVIRALVTDLTENGVPVTSELVAEELIARDGDRWNPERARKSMARRQVERALRAAEDEKQGRLPWGIFTDDEGGILPLDRVDPLTHGVWNVGKKVDAITADCTKVVRLWTHLNERAGGRMPPLPEFLQMVAHSIITE